MTTQTYGPTASNHDGYQGGGSTNITDTYIRVDSTGYYGGVRIDATADQTTMAAATIGLAEFTYYVTSITYDDPNVIWRAEAADSAAVFATGATNISDRTVGTAGVTDHATGVGAGFRTIDVTTLIQEVVNRPGWTGPIVLQGEGQSSDKLRFRTYDNGSNIWSIAITWTPVAPPAGDVPIFFNSYRQRRT